MNGSFFLEELVYVWIDFLKFSAKILHVPTQTKSKYPLGILLKGKIKTKA